AFAALLARRNLPHTLAIAGAHGWQNSPLLAEIKDAGLEERVKLLGYVADEDLPALLSAAEALTYPSLYEGFGLPVLEAMACGVPVAASDTSSLPEVVGEAGLLLDPSDTEAWTDALERLIDDA